MPEPRTPAAAKSAEQTPERMATINIALSDDGEPRDVFVGANGRNFRITRGKNVKVPLSVLEVLDNAVKGVAEQDDHNPEKITVVERKRFAYSVIEMH
jgi:hypothetical protein